MFQESVGGLLSQGPPLVYLDVSGNYLGKDYFSRCVGQALKTNTTLQTLRSVSYTHLTLPTKLSV